ncbi:hypothetical protein QTQ03_25250 [Micromonospora sp. WMMA1363]|uniref:hypothetical protein n=1 Tax=Micromonospora sp. WMMA1363 TaxID=3053985 RepID=UPI00259C72A1|nr:hypothetical protein [Micromonospora sp. WMMA1363]MDM4722742.1 hypothetical protein [Micromonospora sp. WMMA1363]
MEHLLYAAGAIAVIGAAAEVLRRTVGWMIRTVRKLSRLADDLLGEPPSPEYPEGRPGLMGRLARIESRLDALEELRPDGGRSIKDQVGRIAQATGADPR